MQLSPPLQTTRKLSSLPATPLFRRYSMIEHVWLSQQPSSADCFAISASNSLVYCYMRQSSRACMLACLALEVDTVSYDPARWTGG